MVINIGSIQRKLLSHLWLETEQQQQHAKTLACGSFFIVEIKERTDVIQVYKILHDIDKVDKNKLFTLSEYTLEAILRLTVTETIEYDIAMRQLAMKTAHEKSWFNIARSILGTDIACFHFFPILETNVKIRIEENPECGRA